MTIDAIQTAKGMVPSGTHVQGTGKGESPGEFGEMLRGYLESVNRQMVEAQDLAVRGAAGEPVDIADKVIASTKADLSFRLLVQTRNKALAAYEEIMRMQF